MRTQKSRGFDFEKCGVIQRKHSPDTGHRYHLNHHPEQELLLGDNFALPVKGSARAKRSLKVSTLQRSRKVALPHVPDKQSRTVSQQDACMRACALLV